MKILIDIGHPGHVHLFSSFAKIMESKGHELLFTCRQKEFELELLQAAKFNYKSFGKHYKSTLGKIYGLIKFDLQLFFTAIKFKPDVFLSHGSFYAAHISFFIRKPHISFEDTFNFEQINLYKHFTNVILTSDYEHPFVSKKNIKYKGYHELAYLHPNRFKPDINVLSELGISKNEKYCILRFVSWEATHDYNHSGISIKNKRLLVSLLSEHCKVFISSEKKLPPDLQDYAFPLKPERMHHALAFSSLVFGESGTMVSEGAVLGVPGIYLDNTGRLYTDELEKKYQLVFNYSESLDDQIFSIKKAVDIIKHNNPVLYKRRKEKLLQDKIDVTKFLVWFIENYPRSEEIMNENPDYQYNFK
jgi:uncharacterized protein